MHTTTPGRAVLVPLLLLLCLVLPACGDTGATPAVLRVGAIPDQDPERLQRLYGAVASYLEDHLDVPVEYVPVTDYAASVTLFRTGDLDLVWFGGLTGTQARVQTPGARAVAQRDIDARFRSVFIAGAGTGLAPMDDVAGLETLRGKRFTYGSESSTSGRLMPTHFLREAGLGDDDFDGPPGFSGSHDATIDLVEAGSYEAGALNEQVWDARVEAGEVDLDSVVEVFRTPTYADYHWLLRPDVDERLGDGFGDRVRDTLVGMGPGDPDATRVLELFGAGAFVATSDANYRQIEEVAAELGLLEQ